MFLKTITCFCLLLSVCNGERSYYVTDTRVSLLHHLPSAKVEISRPSGVMEDTWAVFSCTAKRKDIVKWRIGCFTDKGHEYNLGVRLRDIEGLQIEYVETITWSSGKKEFNTEVIKILATMDLNGLPIECMSVSLDDKIEYSQFALLKVMPSVITEGTK